MPELPDVETFKRYLNATSLHQRITAVDVRNAYVLKDVSGRELARGLKGRRFESSRRHGKHVFVRADCDVWLRLHFGMTGFLRYFKGEEKTPPHARVVFVFGKDYRLAFDDQRMFGEIGLVEDVDEFLAYLGRNGWNRKSVSVATQALRAFFPCAGIRGWCAAGLAKLGVDTSLR